ncbi:MAG TPA: heme exporter protein CcmB [Chitinophagales bacterium]|nr:heme exporter protein CcmB [Chitinophagales bacterium]
MLKEIKALFLKELKLEWRQRYGFSGILLYLAATVFLIYISLIEMKPELWMTMFWIIMLFTAVSAVAKSFIQESRGRFLYYYTIASPRAVILSKLFYNASMMIVIGTIGLLIYSLMNESPVEQGGYFFLVVILGCSSFAFSFTMMSAIAAKANQNVALMAILSLPFILPILLLLIKLSQFALLKHIEHFPVQDLLLLLLLNIIMIALAIVLFPYLWRE